MTETEDLLVRKIGALLSSCPDVAQTVLCHMTLVELCHSRLVCRLWNTLGTKLMAQRCVPHYTTFHDKGGFRHDGKERPSHRVCRKLFCHNTLQSLTSRPDICLLFTAAPDIPGYQSDDCHHLTNEFNFIKRMLPPQCLGLMVSNLGLVGTVDCGHEAALNKLSQEVCGVRLCPSCSSDPGTPSSRPAKRRRNSDARVRHDSDAPLSLEVDGIPLDNGAEGGADTLSSVHSASAPPFGVGYSTTVVQPARRLSKDEHLQAYFSMLCLTNNIPNVKFKLICYADADRAHQAVDPEFETQIDSIIAENGPLKALLLFENGGNLDVTEAYTEAFILGALNSTEGRVAIGGTLNGNCLSNVSSSHQNSASDDMPDDVACYAIAVCGTGVRAASVVLTPKVKTLDHAVRELEKLKVVYDPSKRSLVFMLACIGRDENWYGRCGRRRRVSNPATLGYALPLAEVARIQKLPASVNVEVAMLRSLFPSTPVIGTFGNGEFGHEYQPRPGGDDTVTEEEVRGLHKLTSRMDSFGYSYSTVVVFLQLDTL